MAAGFGLLRLSPASFWAMTPREFEAALHAVLGTAAHDPISRGELTQLIGRYPDQGSAGP